MLLNAIISVSNKANLLPLGKFLLNNNVKIYSSGGTYKSLMELNKEKYNLNNVVEISSLTQSPEMFSGRVKTLHPKVHGGILAKNTPEHVEELQKYNIPRFDLVIVNLYPFHQTVQNPNATEDDIIDNIDVGGHAMIRAAAKNYQSVLTITDPDDYDYLKQNFNNITLNTRKQFAAKAFNHITQYDMAINNYFNPNLITRQYTKEQNLKYGLNPQQKFAGLYRNINQAALPFKTLNGNPGYINFLDAIYSYSLVWELRKILNMTAATSFKHTSPAGVGLATTPLSQTLEKVYFTQNMDLTAPALAYIRARNSDPLCSFGDFVAINTTVDVCTAKLLAKHISDGIIAFDYEPEALEILKNKKKGSYVVLKANSNWDDYLNDPEIRELHGVTLVQEKNSKLTTLDHFNDPETPFSSKVDLVLANTTAKYTQSNTIVAAKDGQVIAVGAGQQSRIDCMKLVKRKIMNWYLKQHPLCLKHMDTLQDITHQEKINAIISFIETHLVQENEFFQSLKGVSVASDAFFPFTDNIEVAHEFGCQYIVQPGGSIADKEIIEACNKFGIKMFMTGGDMRMFLH